MLENDVEIRRLSQLCNSQLCQILEINDGWKELMSVIPDPDNSLKLKYTVEDMKLIEEGSEKSKKSCSEIFIDEWSTSGRQRPYVSDLVSFLKRACLYRAAEFVTTEVLKGGPLSRPSTGPAARVVIPEIPTPSAPPVNFIDSICSTTKVLTESNNIALNQLYQKRTEQSGTIHYTYEELHVGTHGFSDKVMLGSGGFGSVYFCPLCDNQIVAVKRFFSDATEISSASFRNEIQVVASLSHEHILPLIGFSCDGPDLCIIYSYMSNGSLQDRIECKNVTKPLSWKQRLDIALGAASGIEYLHSFKPRPLIHRDIKSANILLDSDFIAKIGDFGLIRPGSNGINAVTSVQTSLIVGTVAYMAPEAVRAGEVSVKTDVFSFGVVLMELVTGMLSVDSNRETRDLLTMVEEIDDIDSLYDKKVELVDTDIIHGLYDVSQKCLLEKKKRLLIREAIKMLKLIGQK